MRSWGRQVRAALRMGLLWGAGGFATGFLIEMVHNVWPNPVGRMVDIWPAVLAIPGFFCGFTFAMLLAIAARRDANVEKLSVPGFAALGALGGLLVSFGPALMVGVGFGDFKEPYTAWGVTTSLMGPLALGGAVTAAGSLLMARRAMRLESLAGAEPTAELREGNRAGGSPVSSGRERVGKA